MNRFLLGALAMGAVFVLTSFALGTRFAPTTGGPAWTVSQYQLDRAFRYTLQAPGPSGTSISSQLPANGGLIITQVVAFQGITIIVNGVGEHVTSPAGPATLNPPIIARPGDSLTLQFPSGSPIVIAGYTTLPGET